MEEQEVFLGDLSIDVANFADACKEPDIDVITLQEQARSLEEDVREVSLTITGVRDVRLAGPLFVAILTTCMETASALMDTVEKDTPIFRSMRRLGYVAGELRGQKKELIEQANKKLL